MGDELDRMDYECATLLLERDQARAEVRASDEALAAVSVLINSKTAEIKALRAEVARLRADLEVAESRKSDVIRGLKRIEAAAKAWRERNSVAGRLILVGLGPDGKPVEV